MCLRGRDEKKEGERERGREEERERGKRMPSLALFNAFDVVQNIRRYSPFIFASEPINYGVRTHALRIKSPLCFGPC
jgi:hypothetical protein